MNRHHSRSRSVMGNLTLLAMALALAVSLGSLPTSAHATVRDPNGPDTPGPELQGSTAAAGDVLLSTHGYDDMDPAVAYNSVAGQFLAVWRNGSAIVGQLYDDRGVPLGELFAISPEVAGTQRNPAVAFSLNGDRYLVVWEDNRDGNYDIYGQLVDSNGSLLGDDVAIYVGNGNQEYPDVASDGMGFLVVWHGNFLDDSTDVCGRMLTVDGSPGATIQIGADGGTPRRYPAVAYNPSATPVEYLVVFEYDDPSSQIRARRVNVNGSLPGFEYDVTTQPQATNPDLAATPWGATGAHVVVWTDFRSGDMTVYGRVVLSGGDDEFDGGDFVIGGAADLQNRPAIARSPANGQFLVTWEDDRQNMVSSWDVYAQRLSDDANLLGANQLVSNAPDDQVQVAVVGGAEAYFVIWTDWRTSRCDIYGQRVAASGSPLGFEFAVSAEPAVQKTASVAYDYEHAQYLTVWADQRSGTWSIYGQRLSIDGVPTEMAWPIEADGHNNEQPVVAYSGSGRTFVVVWVDQELDKLEGRLVPVSGTATSLFSVINSDGGRNPSLAYSPGIGRFLVAWDSEENVYSRLLGGDGLPLPGDSVQLASDVGVWGFPTIAVDSDNNRFLVVYDDNDDIMGRLVEWDGIPIGSPFLIAGMDLVIRESPSVAYQPATKGAGPAAEGSYLVAYNYWLGGPEYDVYGQLITPDGDLIGGELAIRSEPEELSNYAPQVAYSSAANLFYVLWSEETGDPDGFDLYGQWFTTSGSPATAALPFFHYAGDQFEPRLVYDADHVQGLAVWTDTRRGGYADVYARLGVVDTEPPVALFTRDPSVGRLGDTFTLDAGVSYDDQTPSGALVVRWDWTSDGNWDTNWTLEKVAQVTPALQGTYTVTLAVRDLMWQVDTVSLPIYVLAATANTPPQADLDATPLIGAAGTQFEFDASGSSDAETPWANLSVRWDWENDGQWNTAWNTVKVAQHTYTESGLHLARVDVRDGGGLTDSAVQLVLVLPGDPVALEVDPAGTKLLPNSVLQFRATAWDSYDNEMGNPPVTWSVTDPQAGTIDATGLFTASVYGGEYMDAVVATWDALSDDADVVVVYPYRSYLPLTYRR